MCIYTISICHPQNAHNFGWEMKWPAPYYLISVFNPHTIFIVVVVRHSNIHFHICMVFVYTWMCGKHFSISRSPLFLVHVVDSRKMYTGQHSIAHSLKTHTTNGKKYNFLSHISPISHSLTRASDFSTPHGSKIAIFKSMRYVWH